MKILHELNQLEYGGVERVIQGIVRYDDKNQHTVLAYKDGPFKGELLSVGAKVVLSDPKEEVQVETDLLHIHSGGGVSELAKAMEGMFPVVETIHSPIRSPMLGKYVTARIGVTDAVSRINKDCVTIHNGIDVNACLPSLLAADVKKELGIPEGIPVIGRVGRIGYDKYLEEWLLTCYYLQKEGMQFIPLIVGDEALTAPGLLGKLKLMCASMPVKGVVWVGNRPNVADYLQIMDVFLYPSPSEGFGMVFCEAMLNGAIVVTYNTDVTREVCGGSAILTENSIQGLIQGVKKALIPGIVDELKFQGRSNVVNRFSAERMSRDYQDLYANVYGNFNKPV